MYSHRLGRDIIHCVTFNAGFYTAGLTGKTGNFRNHENPRTSVNKFFLPS